jgi:hypothetical protein
MTAKALTTRRFQYGLRTALIAWLVAGPLLGLVAIPAVEKAMAVRRGREFRKLDEIGVRDMSIGQRRGLSERVRRNERTRREAEQIKGQLFSTPDPHWAERC